MPTAYIYTHKNKKQIDPHAGMKCRILTPPEHGGFIVQVQWENGDTAVIRRDKIVRAK